MKIILISGHAQSGKDTSALYLRKAFELKHPGRVCVTHYADLLKYICSSYFNWDGLKDEQGRTLLQHVGTDIIRAQDPDFWVDFLIRFLSVMKNKWDYVIIPDARFPNEIERFKQAGFDTIHIRITRPDTNALTEEQRSHISETALDDVIPDISIINNNSKTMLRIKCSFYAKEIMNAQKR